jgi:glycosyltransferase involved in cell wall biosynthesis
MVSVVVPAFNEAAAIPQTIADIRAALEDTPSEVIVVDDGSTDATAAVAEAAGARVLKQPHNRGYGAALKAGILASSHDTIIITDADGTYPNHEMRTLLEHYRNGFNMVVGARHGSNYRESIVKAPLRFVLKWLAEFTTGRRIPDVNSGLRVFSRQEIIPYFDTLCDTFSFTTSVTLAYLLTSKFVHYVPISYHRRVGPTKVRLFRDALRTLQYIVQAILYYNPLKLFVLLCGAVLIVAAVAAVVAIAWPSATAWLAVVVSLLVAILVFCLGLVADLLKQIMARR